MIDVQIAPLAFSDAVYVGERMRDDDRREVFACRWNDSVEDLAADCAVCAPLAWTAKEGAEPVAVFGVSQARPGVVQAWMFATDKFPAVVKDVTRFIKQAIRPALQEAGIHRVYAYSIADHRTAHRWMETCFAAVREADHPGFGRRAEKFHTFAWTDPNVHP